MRKTGADNRIELSMRTLNRPSAPQETSHGREDARVRNAAEPSKTILE
jgi:hypothetical protein